ncbi:hypothetical protein MM300_10510 [Evansella sp. LMS18]|uniref:hypothetical protein n=1 Tax=Evansella sp. LMS18 TaxID=2924033 RepID=UPI0020D18658|nr:hypothetical protein [Evansella sp. LMS18]UTR12667.1 hypothetical protein MM300_10510 [Evansella sp. LMS18]
MAETIILIVLMVPFYGLLIWGIIEPEESYLWGRRWMFKKEPEITEAALRLHRASAIFGLFIITLLIGLQIASLF